MCICTRLFRSILGFFGCNHENNHDNSFAQANRVYYDENRRKTEQNSIKYQREADKIDNNNVDDFEVIENEPSLSYGNSNYSQRYDDFKKIIVEAEISKQQHTQDDKTSNNIHDKETKNTADKPKYVDPDDEIIESSDDDNSYNYDSDDEGGEMDKYYQNERKSAEMNNNKKWQQAEVKNNIKDEEVNVSIKPRKSSEQKEVEGSIESQREVPSSVHTQKGWEQKEVLEPIHVERGCEQKEVQDSNHSEKNCEQKEVVDQITAEREKVKKEIGAPIMSERNYNDLKQEEIKLSKSLNNHSEEQTEVMADMA